MRVCFRHTCATFLQTQPLQDLLKFGMCAKFGQLDMDTTTQASAQIRWACQDETQMLVPHETMVVLLEDCLNLKYFGTHLVISVIYKIAHLNVSCPQLKLLKY